MNCCCCGPQNINGLESMFDTKRAAKEASAYLRHGLGSRGEHLIAYLLENHVGLRSVLEIGSGVGSVHYELLRRGIAASVTGVDVSSAYIEAARSIGEQLGLSSQVQYIHGDFTTAAPDISSADVVIMDRVICCYPHLNALLSASAGKAERYLALSYPDEKWWVRIGIRLDNLLRKLRGQTFRIYLHAHKDVYAIAVQNGLKPVHTAKDSFWQITVFERATNGSLWQVRATNLAPLRFDVGPGR